MFRISRQPLASVNIGRHGATARRTILPAPKSVKTGLPRVGAIGAATTARPSCRHVIPAGPARNQVLDFGRCAAPARASLRRLPNIATHLLFQFGLSASLDPADPPIAVPDREYGDDREQDLGEAETEHGGFVRTEPSEGQGAGWRTWSGASLRPANKKSVFSGMPVDVFKRATG